MPAIPEPNFLTINGKAFPAPDTLEVNKDTVDVVLWEEYDLGFVADEPDTWIVHHHIPHHLINAELSPCGLILAQKVVE